MSAINIHSRWARRAVACATVFHALLGAPYGMAQSSAAPAPGAPRLDNSPTPGSADTSAADIAAIARGFDGTGKPPGLEMKEPADFLIFVSFSIPPASLTRLASQARKAGGILLLNGLKDNSLPATAQAVYRIFGKEGAPLRIDPRAFSRYAIKAVPAFVLLSGEARELSCGPASCPEDGYAKASGDVSAGYALEQIARGQPALKPRAQAILRRLGE